jgi:hypothetical protein
MVVFLLAGAMGQLLLLFAVRPIHPNDGFFSFNALLPIISCRKSKSLYQTGGAVKCAKKLPEGDSGEGALSEAAFVRHAGEWPKTLD